MEWQTGEETSFKKEDLRMLGIIGAMAEEVEQLKKEMEAPLVTAVAGMDFYKGKLGGKDVV